LIIIIISVGYSNIKIECSPDRPSKIHISGHYNDYESRIIKLAYRGDDFSI